MMTSSPDWLAQAAQHRYTPPVLWGPTGEHIPNLRCPWCHHHTVVRRGWLLYCDRAHRLSGGTCGWTVDTPTVGTDTTAAHGPVHPVGTVVRRRTGQVRYRVVEVDGDRMRVIQLTGEWRDRRVLENNNWMTMRQLAGPWKTTMKAEDIAAGQWPAKGALVRYRARRSVTTYTVDGHLKMPDGTWRVLIVSTRSQDTKSSARRYKCWVKPEKLRLLPALTKEAP